MNTTAPFKSGTPPGAIAAAAEKVSTPSAVGASRSMPSGGRRTAIFPLVTRAGDASNTYWEAPRAIRSVSSAATQHAAYGRKQGRATNDPVGVAGQRGEAERGEFRQRRQRINAAVAAPQAGEIDLRPRERRRRRRFAAAVRVQRETHRDAPRGPTPRQAARRRRPRLRLARARAGRR